MCSCHVYALKLETEFRKALAVRLVQMNLRRIFKERWRSDYHGCLRRI